MTLYTFSVHGSGKFPVELLRHYRCWPYDIPSAISLTLDSPKIRVVNLASNLSPDHVLWSRYNWTLSTINATPRH